MEADTHIPPHIADYLSGKLSESEARDFEAKMEQDPALMASVKKWLAVEYAGYAEVREAWKQELLDREPGEIRPIVRPLWQRALPYLAAASVILLVAVWFWSRTTPSTEDLFLAYFEPIPAQEVRDTASDQAQLRLANVAFNQGKYQEALELYEQLVEADDTQSETLALSMAQAQLALDQAEDALISLNQAAQFPQERAWLTALAQLKLGRISDAKAGLRRIIAQPDHFYKQKASELLGKLE